ncbi:MAG: ABC transporter permease subunit [Verrucomicrobiota bacterium]
MTFLPIVARELRGAARQPSTYRARTAYALVTSLMAAGLLLLGDLASARRIGSTVFPTLATLAFLYCWITGLRHAADALSEEKREGTLGLLFLTDLRGYDVVLGKLVSVSARTLQGLFAFFPVLALGLVLGGITAGEVWRTAAVLINALFFSLSLGLCVSAFARASHVAIGFSLAALTFVTAVPLALDALLARLWPGPTQVLRFISPVGPATLAFDADYAGRPGRFLAGLALNHVVGWCFLLCASWAVVRTWQERGLSPFGSPFGQTRSRPESPQNRSRRDAERRRRLEINPIFWLAGRHQRQHWLLWVTVGGTALLGIVTISLTFWMGPGIAGLNSVPAAVLDLALRMWVGWYACATLSEAQRTGAVELILATPLSVNQIIEGHTQALQRMFLWPVVVAVVLNLIAGSYRPLSSTRPEYVVPVSVSGTDPLQYCHPDPGLGCGRLDRDVDGLKSTEDGSRGGQNHFPGGDPPYVGLLFAKHRAGPFLDWLGEAETGATVPADCRRTLRPHLRRRRISRCRQSGAVASDHRPLTAFVAKSSLPPSIAL